MLTHVLSAARTQHAEHRHGPTGPRDVHITHTPDLVSEQPLRVCLLLRPHEPDAFLDGSPGLVADLGPTGRTNVKTFLQ